MDMKEFEKDLAAAARDIARSAAEVLGLRDEHSIAVLEHLLMNTCDRVSAIARATGIANQDVRNALKRLKRRGLVVNGEARGVWCASALAYISGLRAVLARGERGD